jgi:hypothetical protein
VIYGNNTRIQVEYRVVLRDPNTWTEYEAYAVNFNKSTPDPVQQMGNSLVVEEAAFVVH